MTVLWCLGLRETKTKRRDDTVNQRKNILQKFCIAGYQVSLLSWHLRVFIEGKMNQSRIVLIQSLFLFDSASLASP